MKKNVLIVDDDPVIRSLIEAILTHETLSSVTAADGAAGIKMLEQSPESFSLVIIDRQMPEMNGIDVLTRMKLNPATATIPTIMLTGETKTEALMEGYERGVDYYITKPFTRQQLVYGLELVLGEYKTPPTSS